MVRAQIYIFNPSKKYKHSKNKHLTPKKSGYYTIQYEITKFNRFPKKYFNF